MSAIKTNGNFVATTPFGEFQSVKTKSGAAFAFIDDKKSLCPLRVVFSSAEFEPNTIVYVDHGNAMHHSWAKDQYEVDGVTFILVPHEFVVVAKASPPPSVKDSQGGE